jgi:predicted DNA binding CopG/RHH family protein
MSTDNEQPIQSPGETAQYEDDPFELGEIKETVFEIAAKDFLPRPSDLVFKKAAPAAKKVTMVLDDFTINAFKEKAQELGGSYQAMIRRLLLEYARAMKQDDKNLSR